MNKLNFYLPFTKADKEKKMVYGFISSESVDSDGEVITKEAVIKAFPDYMQFGNIREMHQNSAVGVTKEFDHKQKGTWIGAKIVDKEAWEKVVEGVYKGFSIGGEVLKKVANIIKELRIIEISLVDRPANPEALFTAVKFSKVNEANSVNLTEIYKTITPYFRHFVKYRKICQVANDNGELMKGYMDYISGKLTDEQKDNLVIKVYNQLILQGEIQIEGRALKLVGLSSLNKANNEDTNQMENENKAEETPAETTPETTPETPEAKPEENGEVKEGESSATSENAGEEHTEAEEAKTEGEANEVKTETPANTEAPATEAPAENKETSAKAKIGKSVGLAMYIGETIQRCEDIRMYMTQKGKPTTAMDKVIPTLKQMMSDECMEDEMNKVQKSESVSKAIDGLKSFIKAEVNSVKSAVDTQLSEFKERLDKVESAPRRATPQTAYTFKKGEDTEQISGSDREVKFAELTTKANKLSLEAKECTNPSRMAEIGKEMEDTYKEISRLKYAVPTASN